MNSIGKEFMEKTKEQYLGESDQDKGVPQPPLELACPDDAVRIDLPAADQLQVKKLDLTWAMDKRRTVRTYSRRALRLEELAYLLWYTQGVQEVTTRPVTLRTVPSAGARHSLETYLLVNNVTGLKPGLYRYIALEHKLMVVDLAEGLRESVVRSAFNQTVVGESAVTFIWTTALYRMKWRYGERSYRYTHLDAGHVCQNLYLAAQAVEAGVCAIGAFDDDQLHFLLGLDGHEYFAVYLATVGKL